MNFWFAWAFIFNSLRYTPRRELRAYMMTLWIILRNCQTVLKQLHGVCVFCSFCFSPAGGDVYSFSAFFLSALVIVHSSGCDVVFHCSLSIHFHNDSWRWVFLSWTYMYIYSLGKFIIEGKVSKEETYYIKLIFTKANNTLGPLNSYKN